MIQETKTQATLTHPDVRPVCSNRHRFLPSALLTLAAAGLGMSRGAVPPSRPAGAAGATPTRPDIRPCHVHIPDKALDDMRERLAATRWRDQETVADPSQGVQLAKLQQLVRYWGSDYDWHK